jgi:PAS domain S-box-containing protein
LAARVNDPAARPINGARTMRISVLPRAAGARRALAGGLTRPIFGAFALVLVVVTGMFALQVAGAREQHEAGDSARHSEQVLRVASGLERRVIDLETGLRGYLLTRDERYLEPYLEARASLPAQLAALVDLSHVPAQRRRALGLRAAIESYQRSYAAPLRANGLVMTRRDVLADSALGKRKVDAIRSRFAAFNGAEQRLAVVRRERWNARAERTTVIGAFGLVLSAALLLALAAYLRRRVLRPVQQVAHAAGELADGRLDVRVPVDGSGEIATLAGAFNGMAGALAERQRELRVSNDRLQGILDHATSSIAVRDRDGRYLVVNRRWQEVSGFAEADALGRTDTELFGPALAVPGRATDLEALRSRTAVESEREVELRGRRSTHHIVKFALLDAAGEAHAVASMSTDVTEHRAALAAAVEASRSKSEFLANMSHEIRTPLNGVIGMTELLLGTDLSAEQREYARTAVSSGEALLDVINDILDFSKIEAGRLELDDHDFDLREAIEDTCEMLAPQAHSRGLELLAWVDADVPALVNGDRGRMRQIVTNLLSNAIKFTEQGEVTVRVKLIERELEAATVRIEVADTGIGIEPAKLEAVFESFSQADTSTTRRYGGTGLGLAISRQLATMMGGELGAESVPGAGSTFHCTLRLGLADAPGRGRRRSPRVPEGLSVLVVDDNATNRQIVEAYLDGCGARVDQAASGGEALTLMHTACRAGAPFELVVLDYNMPGMDGLDLARAVRRAPSLRGAQLVMLTSSGDHRAAAREAGIEHMLTKPVRRARLLEAVAEAVGGRDEVERPAVAPAAGVTPAATGARVLVAEDNAINRLVVEGMLTARGIGVDVAENGREALDLLAERRYDAILMDCQMPELDGYAATAAIRADERSRADGERMPIIAMTAHAMAGDRERCLAAGMDDYLAKPLRPEEVDRVIAAWLSTAVPEPEPAADAAAPLEGLIDEARMRLFRQDYADVAGRLAELFAEATPELLDTLRAAHRAGDGEALGRAAHKLKGSCQNVGATFMATLASSLERGEAPAGALDELEAAYEPTRDALIDALGGAA